MAVITIVKASHNENYRTARRLFSARPATRRYVNNTPHEGAIRPNTLHAQARAYASACGVFGRILP